MLATETSPNPPAHHVGAPATRRRLPPSVRAIPEPNQATMDELSPIVAKMRLPNCPGRGFGRCWRRGESALDFNTTPFRGRGLC